MDMYTFLTFGNHVLVIDTSEALLRRRLKPWSHTYIIITLRLKRLLWRKCAICCLSVEVAELVEQDVIRSSCVVCMSCESPDIISV